MIASGASPRRCASSSDATTTAAAPSLTPGELPAVCVPPGVSGFSAASASTRRVAARALVGVDDGVALPARDRDRHDLLREPAAVDRRDGPLVRARRPRVEIGAIDAELRADGGRLLEHLLAGPRVAQRVPDHRVDQRRVAEPVALAGAHREMRRVRHRLHAAGEHRRVVADLDQHVRDRDRPQAGRAHLVHRLGAGVLAHADGQRHLPRRDVPLPGLDHGAEHAVPDLGRRDLRPLDRAARGDRAELDGGNGCQATEESAEGRPRGAEDHGAMHGRPLYHGVCARRSGPGEAAAARVRHRCRAGRRDRRGGRPDRRLVAGGAGRAGRVPAASPRCSWRRSGRRSGSARSASTWSRMTARARRSAPSCAASCGAGSCSSTACCWRAAPARSATAPAFAAARPGTTWSPARGGRRRVVAPRRSLAPEFAPDARVGPGGLELGGYLPRVAAYLLDIGPRDDGLGGVLPPDRGPHGPGADARRPERQVLGRLRRRARSSRCVLLAGVYPAIAIHLYETTVGKHAAGLAVRRSDGSRVGFWRALWRELGARHRDPGRDRPVHRGRAADRRAVPALGRPVTGAPRQDGGHGRRQGRPAPPAAA